MFNSVGHHLIVFDRVQKCSKEHFSLGFSFEKLDIKLAVKSQQICENARNFEALEQKVSFSNAEKCNFVVVGKP